VNKDFGCVGICDAVVGNLKLTSLRWGEGSKLGDDASSEQHVLSSDMINK
jgi:hypothetical protein